MFIRCARVSITLMIMVAVVTVGLADVHPAEPTGSR